MDAESELLERLGVDPHATDYLELLKPHDDTDPSAERFADFQCAIAVTMGWA